MGFSRCLACNSEWNTCKAFVRTCTDFYTLNIATLNMVVDRVGFVGQVHDFSIFRDRKVDCLCTICQVALWCFAFF